MKQIKFVEELRGHEVVLVISHKFDILLLCLVEFEIM